MTGPDLIRQFIALLGENPDREGLCETPRRVLSAWQTEWTAGYHQDPKAVLKTFNVDGADELVFQTGIPIFSHCEHHLTPFFGYAHVGYLPNGRVVGLSKLSRLVDIYARRMTIQERIGIEVVEALMTHLDARGAGVVLQCRHLCMESRGIQRPGTITVTSVLRGLFKTVPELRSEFLSLINTAMQGVKVL